MLFKLLNIIELQNSYNGEFIERYTPINGNEIHIYMNIAAVDLNNFKNHFRSSARELKNPDDYPTSESGFANGRIANFCRTTHIYHR
jgi:hypothetical protein